MVVIPHGLYTAAVKALRKELPLFAGRFTDAELRMVVIVVVGEAYEAMKPKPLGEVLGATENVGSTTG